MREPGQRGKAARSLREYQWADTTPLVLVHLAPLAAFWTGTRWQDWACCGVLYVVRMFGVTGGYHRYFAHRSYRTGRVMQFLLAFVAESTAQQGVLWWASHHRDHHRHSDTALDVHSPAQTGFWYSHIGWIYDHNDDREEIDVPDLSRYPELVWLDRHWLVPPVLMAFVVLMTLGLSGLLIGFFLSTVLVWHGTFTINSLSHIFGRRRFDSGDDSRNNWFLALLTMGEGWHNNHHYYMGSARQGFYWWEIDVTYGMLKVLQWSGLIWDVRVPPARVYEAAAALRLGAIAEQNPPLAVPTSIEG